MSDKSAIVLTLHGVCANEGDDQYVFSEDEVEYSITYEVLEYLVSALERRKVCNVSEFYRKDGGDWIVLTVDDGFLTDFELIFPLLKSKGLSATCFITANNMDDDGYMSSTQIKLMSDYGIEIGSHGLNHVYLVDLPKDQVKHEMKRSKYLLEDVIGKEIVSFAPVGGHYASWMVKYGKSIGYRYFASMIPGFSRLNGNSKVLRRNHIKAGHDETYLDKLLRGDKKVYTLNISRYYILFFLKKIIGMKRYDCLKRTILNLG